MNEIDSDLNQITSNLSQSKNKTTSAFSSVPFSSTDSAVSSSSNSARRSVSNLVNASRALASSSSHTLSSTTTTTPTTVHNNDMNSPLFSKSTSSIAHQNLVEQQNSINNTSANGGGYKYTPLRQSWTNLSQMNTLSPYSLLSTTAASSSSSTTHARHRIDNEDACSSKSEQIRSNPSPALFNKNLRKITTSRPSSAGSGTLSDFSNRLHFDEDQPPPRLIGAVMRSDIRKISEREENLEELNKNGQDDCESPGSQDYIYVDDELEIEEESRDKNKTVKNNFYKKYRAQNIRQKKQLHKSPQDSSSNKNLIIIPPKSGLNLKQQELQKQIDYDSENDQMPIKLMSDSDELSSETGSLNQLRIGTQDQNSKTSSSGLKSMSTIGMNGQYNSSLAGTSSSSSNSNSLRSTSTNCFSTTNSTTTNSLSRSRSRSRSGTASSASSDSYRGATISSIMKSHENFNNNHAISSNSGKEYVGVSHSVSSTSTQYKSLINNMFQKKKPSFY